MLWLKKGDKNTKFFHQIAYGKKRKNIIRTLKDESEMVHLEDEAIGKVVMEYFEGMSASSSPPPPLEMWRMEYLRACLHHLLPPLYRYGTCIGGLLCHG